MNGSMTTRQVLVRVLALYTIVGAVAAMFPFPHFDADHQHVGILTPLYKELGL